MARARWHHWPAMFWYKYLETVRAPGEAVRAWLLYVLRDGGWKTAREIEAARVEAGIGKRALRTARERLLADSSIEKRRDGFQGPWVYALDLGEPPDFPPSFAPRRDR